MITKCICPKSTVVFDHERGEAVCSGCGIVIDEKEAIVSGLQVLEQMQSGNSSWEMGTRSTMMPSELRKIGVIHGGMREMNQNRRHERILAILRSIDVLLGMINAKPIVRREAVEIFKKCRKHGLTHMKKSTLVASACVSIACRMHGTVVKEQVIVDYSTMSRMYFRRFIREVSHELKIPRVNLEERTRTLIASTASTMELRVTITRRAAALFEKIMKVDDSFITNPMTAAMTLLYLCDPNAVLENYAKYGCTNTSIRANIIKYNKFLERHRIDA